MSTQIVITKNIINYISTNGYRSDPIIDELKYIIEHNIYIIELNYQFTNTSTIKLWLEKLICVSPIENRLEIKFSRQKFSVENN